MNYSYIVGLVIIFIIIIIFSFLSIYKTFVYSPIPQEVFIDPELRTPNKECSVNPQLCTVDKDCENCVESQNVEITCQDMNRSELQSKKYGKSGGKYCLPKKADQPCNEKLGGMWAWSGYSGLEGTPGAQEWDCLCTIPEIAASNGCKLNNNICKGGEFNYDALGAQSNTPPLPVHCKCPEGHVKVWTENQAILCVPYGPGFCADEKGVYNEEICKSFFSNPNDNICGLEPKTGVNDCGTPAPKPDHKINNIMCADLVDKKNKGNCIKDLNDQMKTRGVSKCHDLSILDLSLVGKKCKGIPEIFSQNMIDNEKKNLCAYINAKDTCAATLKTELDNAKMKTCSELEYETVFSLGKKCNAFPAEILSI